MSRPPFTTPAEALCWLWDHPIFQHTEELQNPDGSYAFREPQSLWEAGDIHILPKIWHVKAQEYREDAEPGVEVWAEIETGPYVGRVEMLKHEEEHGTEWPACRCSHDFDLDTLEPTHSLAVLALAQRVWAKYGDGTKWMRTMLRTHMEYEIPPTDRAWLVCEQTCILLSTRKLDVIPPYLKANLQLLQAHPLTMAFLYASRLLSENPFPETSWTA